MLMYRAVVNGLLWRISGPRDRLALLEVDVGPLEGQDFGDPPAGLLGEDQQGPPPVRGARGAFRRERG